MSTVDTSWTCPHPGCGSTVLVYGSAADTRWAIAACQTRHNREHRKADELRRNLPRKAG